MPRRFPTTAAVAAAAVAVAGVASAVVVAAQPDHQAAPQQAQLASRNISHRDGTPVAGRHSLLISVDGLHASDLQAFVRMFPKSNLARLSRRGTTYNDALTSFPSDSFPGMLALATGGTPKQTGVYYDVSYNRAMWDPGTNCQGAPGQATTYDESLDQTTDNLSGTSNTGLTGPGFSASSIGSGNLPLAMVNGVCTPIAPHNYVEANTIFEVAHNAGLYTAWSEKHPAYDILNGNDRYKTAPGAAITDLYTPEINSTIHPGQLTVPFGPDAGQPVTGSGDYTSSVDAVMAYDNLKVGAVMNEINGETSQGAPVNGTQKVPSIFGMNFQSVSVGQKLPVGGYYDNGRTFSPALLTSMEFVDSSVGRLVTALNTKGLLDSTQIIITAKHGQSPKNRGRLHRIPESNGTTSSLVGFVNNAAGANPLASDTADDVGLLWWNNAGSTASTVAAALNADKNTQNLISVDHVFSGTELHALFGTPAQTADYNDLGNRVPDVVVQPQQGVIYSTSVKKVAEHGGGTMDDRNVALLVVNGDHLGPRTVRTRVETTQVAPTILRWLGLNPNALTAAVAAGTTVLPRSSGWRR
jgi:hypothetical protein